MSIQRDPQPCFVFVEAGLILLFFFLARIASSSGTMIDVTQIKARYKSQT
jgi:hypothetical protein